MTLRDRVMVHISKAQVSAFVSLLFSLDDESLHSMENGDMMKF